MSFTTLKGQNSKELPQEENLLLTDNHLRKQCELYINLKKKSVAVNQIQGGEMSQFRIIMI